MSIDSQPSSIQRIVPQKVEAALLYVLSIPSCIYLFSVLNFFFFDIVSATLKTGQDLKHLVSTAFEGDLVWTSSAQQALVVVMGSIAGATAIVLLVVTVVAVIGLGRFPGSVMN